MGIVSKLRAKLGDFWWYTLMIFCACRASDALNALVGLYLVPKYVSAEELGAVLPLSNFATTLTFPIGVLATVFMKEVNVLAVRGEYGRMKSLMRGVFLFGAIFLVAAIIISHLALPLFLERIRIARGSLGFLILAAAFCSAVSPIYLNALQALNKFKTISLINLLGGPLRFLAMIAAMPFRALSGYFVGQMASPSFTIVASVWSLRRELSVKAERYWSSDTTRRLLKFAALVGLYMAIGAVPSFVEPLVLRSRLPDGDSAAYYILTRFSEISLMLSATIQMILFPYVSERTERGESARAQVVKAIAASLVFAFVFALPFLFVGEELISFLPNGCAYASYAKYIPWLVGIAALTSVQAVYTTARVAEKSFGFLWWWTAVNLGYSAALWYAPNLNTLSAVLGYFTISAVLKAAFSIAGLLGRRGK